MKSIPRISALPAAEILPQPGRTKLGESGSSEGWGGRTQVHLGNKISAFSTTCGSLTSVLIPKIILEAGSLRISRFIPTPLVRPSFLKYVPIHSKRRIIFQLSRLGPCLARGGAAPAGLTLRQATFTCLAGSKRTRSSSATSGSALLELRLMALVREQVPARGPSYLAHPLGMRAGTIFPKEPPEDPREVAGLRRRPRTLPGTFGFSAARVWIRAEQPVC